MKKLTTRTLPVFSHKWPVVSLSFLLLFNLCQAQSDSTHQKAFSFANRKILNWEAKVFLNNSTTVKGVLSYYNDEVLVIDSTKEIPIAQIKKIRLRRHIIGKAGIIGGIAGFAGGFVFGYIYTNGNTGGGFLGGLGGFIPGALTGALIGTVVNLFYKHSFKIRGKHENVQRITNRLGVGKGKDW